MIATATVVGVISLYLMASSFYAVVPARHQAIWTQFQRVKYNETSPPGFYWKWPWVKGIYMFTGPDKDDVSYTCGTKDGITFEGTVSITNQIVARERFGVLFDPRREALTAQTSTTWLNF